MVRRGQRVGVAVSGGADSVFLLHVLVRMRQELGVEVVVLHLNHGLRGAESDGDEEFVRALAGELGVQAVLRGAEIGRERGNLEEAGRAARRAFFAEARAELGLDVVATGHTRSDQAETVLFRMTRGTGETGLRGILPVTQEGLIRPLLGVSRGEIRAWLAAERIPWREDSSNQETALARNLLRLEVMPRLERINPEVEAALSRLAAAAGRDEEYWRLAASGALEEVLDSVGDGEMVVRASGLSELGPALGQRVIRLVLERICGSLRRFTRGHVEDVWRLAVGQRGEGRLRLPQMDVWRSLDWVRFAVEVEERGGGAVGIAGPGLTIGAGWRLEVTEVKQEERRSREVVDSRYNKSIDLLDAECVPFPWILRGWRAGDRYQPVGHCKDRKLKDMFGSADVPCWDRPRWPMLECAGRLMWSRKFGSAAWAAAGPRTERVLRIRELKG